MDDEEEYFGVGTATKVDSLGREWVLTAVDRDALDARVAAYDDRLANKWGPTGSFLSEHYPQTMVVSEEGVNEEHEQLAAGYEHCFSSGRYWLHHMVVEPDLAPAAVPLASRGRKVVLMDPAPDTGLQEGMVCSGSIVAPGWILTAQHCVGDGSGLYFSGGDRWCSQENLLENTVGPSAECLEVAAIYPATGWTGTEEGRDLALVELDGDFGIDPMPLSDQPQSSIQGVSGRLRGFASKTYSSGSCSSSERNSGIAVTTYTGYWAWDMRRSSGPFRNTFGDEIQYDASAGVGMSGGPIFYCPTGNCNEGHWQTGVIAETGKIGLTCVGNFCADIWVQGPWMFYHRPWILGLLP